MPSIAELRQRYPGKRDDELVHAYSEVTGQSAAAGAIDLGIDPHSFVQDDPGFVSAAQNSLYGLAGAAGQLTQDVTGGRLGTGLEEFGDRGQYRNPVTLMEGESDSLFKNVLTNFAERPVNSTMQALGVAAGLMGPHAGAKLGLGGYRAARGIEAVGKTGGLASTAGASAYYGLPSYGSIRDSQEEKGANDAVDMLTAGAGALTIGAMEGRFGPEAWLSRGIGAGIGGPGKNFVRTGLKTGLIEGAEEMAQTPIERAASYEDVMSMETLDQMAAGGVVGFAAGTPMGMAAHPFMKKPIPAGEERDLLNPEPNTQGDLFTGQFGAPATYEAAQEPELPPGPPVPYYGENLRTGQLSFLDDQLARGDSPAMFDQAPDVVQHPLYGLDAEAQAFENRQGGVSGYRSALEGEPGSFENVTPRRDFATPGIRQFGAVEQTPEEFMLEQGIAPPEPVAPVPAAPAAPQEFKSKKQNQMWEQALAATQDQDTLASINQAVSERKFKRAEKLIAEAAAAPASLPGTATTGASPAAATPQGLFTTQPPAVPERNATPEQVQTYRANLKNWVMSELTPAEATFMEYLRNADMRQERTAEEVVDLRNFLMADRKAKVEAKGGKIGPKDEALVDSQLAAILDPELDADGIGTSLRAAAIEFPKLFAKEAKDLKLTGVTHQTYANRVDALFDRLDARAAAAGVPPEVVDTILGLDKKSDALDLAAMSEAEVAQIGGMGYRRKKARGKGSDYIAPSVVRSENDDFNETTGYDRNEEVATKLAAERGTGDATETGEAIAVEDTTEVEGGLDDIAAKDTLAELEDAMAVEGVRPSAIGRTIEDAAQEWDDSRIPAHGDPEWKDLTADQKQQWANMFFRWDEGVEGTSDAMLETGRKGIANAAKRQGKTGTATDGRATGEVREGPPARRAPDQDQQNPDERPAARAEEGTGPAADNAGQVAKNPLELRVEQLRPQLGEKQSARLDKLIARYTGREIDLDRFTTELETMEEQAFDPEKGGRGMRYSKLDRTSNSVSYINMTPAEQRFVKSGAFNTYLRDYLSEIGTPWWQRPDVSLFEGQLVVPAPDVDLMRGFSDWLADATENRGEIPPQMRDGTFHRELLGAKTGATSDISRSKDNAKTGTTVEAIMDTLKASLGPAVMRQVTVFQTSAEAVAARLLDETEAVGTQAWVSNDPKRPGRLRAYFIADSIAAGNELPVLLHELGVHMGMRGLLGQTNLNRLAFQVKKWALKNDGSTESEIAKKALARVKSAQKGGVDMQLGDVVEERIAYFVEEAVKAGIDPTVAKPNSEIGRWFTTLWNAFKDALRKLGVTKFDSLTAQDVVNLAMSAAAIDAATETDFDLMEDGPAKNSIEKLARMYGSSNWLRDYIKTAVEFFANDAGDAQFQYMADSPMIARLKDESDAQLNRLQNKYTENIDIFSDTLEMDHNNKKLGPFTGYRTYGFMDTRSEKAVTLVYPNELLNDIMTRARELGLTFAELLDETPAPIVLTVDAADGALVIGSAPGGSFTAKWLEERGLFEDAVDSNGDTVVDSEGDPWKRMKGVTNAQIMPLLAISHANIRRLLPTVETIGIQWERLTGATGSGSKNTDAIGRSGAAYFSKDYTVTAREAAVNAAANIDFGNRWDATTPKLMTLHQLKDWFGDKLTKLEEYVRNFDKMSMAQQRIMQDGHKVTQEWVKLDKTVMKQLHRVMLDATLQGVHPDLEFTDDLNAHLGKTPEAKAKYDAVRAKYDALSQDAKDVYLAAKQRLTANWDERRKLFAGVVTAAYQKRIDERIANGDQKEADRLAKKRDKEIKDHDNKIKEIKGPYFPLMRFGDYIVTARSTELVAQEELADKATGDARKEAEKTLNKMRTDAKHYRVEAFQSNAVAQKRAGELAKQGLMTEAFKADQFNAQFRPFAASGLEHIETMIDGSFGSNAQDRAAASRMKDLMTEVYISSMPEHAALQRQLKREGIEGASDDMLRAFGEVMEKDAFFLSRMEYSKELADNLFHLKREARKAGVKYQHVYDNLQQRVGLDFTYTRTPVQDFISKASGVFHLGIAPAFLLTNMTQPWMITMPQLAGKYGAARTFGAIRNAWADSGRLIKEGKGGVFNLNDIDFAALPEGAERDMLKEIADLGQLDITQTADMGLLAEGMPPALYKGMKVFNWATHHIELHNRVTTALAAFRMEMAKSDGDIASAKKAAYDAVVRTQLDYSGTNAAYFMKHGVGPLGGMNKLVYQFRKYQQGMVYLLIRDAKLAFAGDTAALKSLSYLMGMQIAFAGVSGVPLFAPLLALASLGFDDDDKEGDPETWLRNLAADAVGPEAARTFFRGLPTMLGADLSNNLGMGSMFHPLPMMRGDSVTEAKTGKDAVKEIVVNIPGAWLGMGSSMADAVISGDLEKAMPRFIRNPIKAAKYADEGLMTRNKAEVIAPEDFDGWDLAYRALGFSTVKEAEYYTAKQAKENVSGAINGRRTELLRDYATMRIRGEDTADVEKMIREFNADHPEKGLRIDRGTMLKAVKTRRDAAKTKDETGVTFRRNEATLEEITRFAR